MDKILPRQFGDFSDRVFVHDVLESTNITAKELAKAGAAHGTTVIAERQTAGRGRHGRSFYSPAQAGIYMSTILHRHVPDFAEPTLITIHAAVAVCEAISVTTGKNPQIKWVNDIFLGGKKICGILAESAADAMIVGIGVNFAASAGDFPEDLRHIASAIFMDEPPTISRGLLAAEILARMTNPTAQSSRAELLEKYRQRLFMLGELITVKDPRGDYTAVALDINDMGHLIVQKDNGEILALNSGEVSVRAL
ncbi:MAG: biotin--[acetyl-CoA-carboxylase] ligase [Clostridiales bacterium]|jgi:BirA family biotin operon repressor/biotin-[acetyl-CoA-carboxylase] ligase|nr:biotin--[acetyl-CoA-carboxylase] ligase [Clostridiales bacterium]